MMPVKFTAAGLSLAGGSRWPKAPSMRAKVQVGRDLVADVEQPELEFFQLGVLLRGRSQDRELILSPSSLATPYRKPNEAAVSGAHFADLNRELPKPIIFAFQSESHAESFRAIIAEIVTSIINSLFPMVPEQRSLPPFPLALPENAQRSEELGCYLIRRMNSRMAVADEELEYSIFWAQLSKTPTQVTSRHMKEEKGKDGAPSVWKEVSRIEGEVGHAIGLYVSHTAEKQWMSLPFTKGANYQLAGSVLEVELVDNASFHARYTLAFRTAKEAEWWLSAMKAILAKAPLPAIPRGLAAALPRSRAQPLLTAIASTGGTSSEPYVVREGKKGGKFIEREVYDEQARAAREAMAAKAEACVEQIKKDLEKPVDFEPSDSMVWVSGSLQTME